MKAPSSALLKAMSRQVTMRAAKVPADRLQLIKSSGVIDAALRGDPNNPKFRQAIELLKQATPLTLKLKVWKTVKLGGKSAAELIGDLEAAGYRISDWARYIKNQSEFVGSSAREVKIARIKVRDLGFTEMLTRMSAVYERISTSDVIDLLPPDAAPYVRLAYNDQPMDEWLGVPMKSFSGSGSGPTVFVSRDDHGALLSAGPFDPDGLCSLDDQLLVALRK